MWRQLQLEEQQQQQEELTVAVYTANVPGAGADTCAMNKNTECAGDNRIAYAYMLFAPGSFQR
jgi:hypothetical protein